VHICLSGQPSAQFAALGVQANIEGGMSGTIQKAADIFIVRLRNQHAVESQAIELSWEEFSHTFEDRKLSSCIRTRRRTVG
jgi:hypothetical protein